MNEPNKLEPRKKLTYEELVNILCILAVRLERLEDLFLAFLQETSKQDEFQTEEVLKARMELMRHQNKEVPFKRFISKRVSELNGSLKGFITYYHENLTKKKPEKPKSKYT